MPKAKARTGADFAQRHLREHAGIHKIQIALAQMAAVGPEHWEYEADLSKDPYSVATRDLAELRSRFAKHVVTTEVQAGERPKKVWFASAAVAAKYRPEGQKLEGQE